MKFKTNSLFYKSNSTNNINLKKNKNLNLIYYIPKTLNLFKNLNIQNELLSPIFRKRKPLPNINLLLSLSSENRLPNKRNLLNKNNKNSKSQEIFSTRIMNENNKKNYSKCFEINKKFLIITNPSIMGKRMEQILMKK